VLFYMCFNLAIPRRSFQSHIGPGHNYYCYVYCCVHWKCFLFYIESRTSCINYQTLFNFSLVYNLMCLCLICQILSLYFIRCPLFMCHCLILTWSCLCVTKEDACSALRICLDIKHVVWHSAYCYIVPSITSWITV
jgi:hypothetical protein